MPFLDWDLLDWGWRRAEHDIYFGVMVVVKPSAVAGGAVIVTVTTTDRFPQLTVTTFVPAPAVMSFATVGVGNTCNTPGPTADHCGVPSSAPLGLSEKIKSWLVVRATD
jgi:hypothetical protein